MLHKVASYVPARSAILYRDSDTKGTGIPACPTPPCFPFITYMYTHTHTHTHSLSLSLSLSHKHIRAHGRRRSHRYMCVTRVTNVIDVRRGTTSTLWHALIVILYDTCLYFRPQIFDNGATAPATGTFLFRDRTRTTTAIGFEL